MAPRESIGVSWMLILLSFAWLLIQLPFATPLNFNFSSFDPSTPDSIEFQGDAFFNRVIRLTKNELQTSIAYSAGRAVHRQPLVLWDANTGKVTDFMTHFSFAIAAVNDTGFGDGLAFFLAPFPSVIPDNSTGGTLGLFDVDLAFNASMNRMVAVEFDTFKNDWDPSPDHVGINVNSIVSSANVSWNASLKDGTEANAWIWYNSSIQTLSVFLTYEKKPAFTGESSLSYVVDLKGVLPETVAVGFSASTGRAIEIHEIRSWDFYSSLVVKKKSRIALMLALIIAAGVIAVASGIIWFMTWQKKVASQTKEEDSHDLTLDDEFANETGPKRFSFGELDAATRNFAQAGKLGEGGFGEVYKGVLSDSKLEVAIKRVSARSKQGKKEYMSEVKIISRLRHRNLVQLVGWCHDNGEFLLVYEFMPNGSLDAYLYGPIKFLDWPVRYKIVLGLASSLLYLHEEWEQCVVHRDIKPSNVMLDSAYNAKLGDFGLARLVDHEIGAQTTFLAGTMGYLAPESVTINRASKESDVYSFGVVALEVACGRRPVEPKEDIGKVKLVEWVWDLYGRRVMLEAADQRLKMNFDEKEMERLMVVGLWCAHPDHTLRPSIGQAINVLKFEAPLPELPLKLPVPVFFPPPMDANKFIFASSAGDSGGLDFMSSGYTTNSSRLTKSSSLSSAPDLSSHKSNV